MIPLVFPTSVLLSFIKMISCSLYNFNPLNFFFLFVHSCACAYVRRPEVDGGCLSGIICTLVFEMQSHTEPVTHCLS